jgi:hypothetical protein
MRNKGGTYSPKLCDQLLYQILEFTIVSAKQEYEKNKTYWESFKSWWGSDVFKAFYAAYERMIAKDIIKQMKIWFVYNVDGEDKLLR